MNFAEAELLHFLAQESKNAYDEVLPEHSIPISDRAAYRGFIAVTDFGTVISIKGTASLRDMLVDVLIAKGTFLKDWAVHLGFLWEFNQIWPMIRSRQIKYPVYVTGHSLGGALATLVGMALKRVEGVQTHVVTFGSPRVGDQEFVKAFESYVQSSVRVVHAWDIIPRLPKIDFKHVGGLMRVMDDGSLAAPHHSLWGWMLDLVEVARADLDWEAPKDHHVEYYVTAMSRLLERVRDKR